MKTHTSKLNYLKAKTKVEKLKSFYSHLTTYIIINSVITAIKVMIAMNNGATFNNAFFDLRTLASWLVWGVFLSIHIFFVFGLPLIFGEDWEERKIEKYMDEELQNK